jgi:hypothetical protein
MTITVGPMRQIFESAVQGKTGTAAIQEGLRSAQTKFESLIGLADDKGRRNINQNGEPFVDSKNARIPARQIPLGVISEAVGGLFGRNWRDTLTDQDIRPGGANYGLAQENIGNSAVVPGAFTNINAWGNAFGGLLEATALEAYHSPDFIGDQLFETQQSVQRSERMPGVSAIGDVAEEMSPGQNHPRVQVGERFVDTPITKKYGLGMDITKEAVLFDPMGNQLLTQAENVGRMVRLRKEKRQLQTFLGITNTYKYGGTSYNTYATSGNWINKIATNELLDWTDVDAVMNLFANMTDQETGESVAITGGFQLLVMPAKQMTAKKLLTDTTVQSRTATTQAVVSEGANPLIGSFTGAPLVSPIAYTLLQESGISAANAKNYWFMGQFTRAFKYKQNFPLTVTKITANSYQMEDAGLVLSIFASEMGAPAIVEPRYTAESYQA